MKLLAWIVVFLVLEGNAFGATFHVTTDGSGQGDGSAARPWDLKTALDGKHVRAEDLVYVHGGTYKGAFVSRLSGTEERPITVRAVGGQRVIIDLVSDNPQQQAIFAINGQYAIFRDLEIMSSDPKRQTEMAGSFPMDIKRGTINVQGSHIRIVNCILHDCFNGIGFWAGGEGGEIYGCLIYNNGWRGPDRGHGHGIYTQNRNGVKRITDNVIFNQFGYGIHAYGSSMASIRGYRINGNAIFNNGAPAGRASPNILVGGASAAERIEVISNFTYSSMAGGGAQFGYGTGNQDISLTRNVFQPRLSFKSWKSIQFIGNTVVGSGLVVTLPAGVERKVYHWDENHYFFTAGKPFAVAHGQDHADALGWEGWRELADEHGNFTAGRATGKWVFVRPNRYERGRANVIVYNWDKSQSVQVDLKNVLRVGQKFRIVRVEDYFGPAVLEGTWQGGAIELPMRPGNVALPIGMGDARIGATEPEFGVFVVLGEGR